MKEKLVINLPKTRKRRKQSREMISARAISKTSKQSGEFSIRSYHGLSRSLTSNSKVEQDFMQQEDFNVPIIANIPLQAPDLAQPEDLVTRKQSQLI